VCYVHISAVDGEATTLHMSVQVGVAALEYNVCDWHRPLGTVRPSHQVTAVNGIITAQ